MRTRTGRVEASGAVEVSIIVRDLTGPLDQQLEVDRFGGYSNVMRPAQRHQRGWLQTKDVEFSSSTEGKFGLRRKVS